MHSDNLDFAGPLDILDRYAPLHRLTDDNMIGLWGELDRGIALAGARRGPSTPLLARCLRSASASGTAMRSDGLLRSRRGARRCQLRLLLVD